MSFRAARPASVDGKVSGAAKTSFESAGAGMTLGVFARMGGGPAAAAADPATSEGEALARGEPATFVGSAATW